ncbi:MAG TPA: superoxide dismutase [Prosthecobacter sp.]|nr:superoxide dismutase [Prosthecobacter sp.]
MSKLKETLDAQSISVGNVAALMSNIEGIIRPSNSRSVLPLGRLISLGMSGSSDHVLPPKTVRVIRQSGGGHVNHTAFWRFLGPHGSGPSGPQGDSARAIREHFGSVRNFRRFFKEVAMSHVGSGWAWLVFRQDKALVVTTTFNEDNPLMKDIIPWHQAGRPILALDLWEHSYYDAHGDDRESYVDSWWKVVNWTFVERAYQIVTKIS